MPDTPDTPDTPEDELLEPEDAGEHDVPTDLLELHEAMEWQSAVDEAEEAEA